MERESEGSKKMERESEGPKKMERESEGSKKRKENSSKVKSSGGGIILGKRPGGMINIKLKTQVCFLGF